MLTYRLNILNDVVDYFVLVEATHTFIGKEKPLCYQDNKHLFEKFNHKIIHVIVDDFPHKYPDINIGKNEQWNNEFFQRNCISRGINKLNINNNDIIIIADVDEIPNPKTLELIKNHENIVDIYIIELDFYYYNLNCKMNHKWYGTKILTFNKYKNLNICCQDIRMYDCPIIKNAGWHLSYFGNEKFIKNKLENFSHQEYNHDKFTNEELISERIKNGKDLFDREDEDIIYVPIEDNDNLPPKYDVYLRNFYINKHIAFWGNQLCDRGTSVGLYNYALYNEKLLRNKSYIFYEKNNPNNNIDVVEKFKRKFVVFPVENFNEVDTILLQNKLTHIFIIKSGELDGRISKVAKNCIQCVFNCNEPHGDVFCSISKDVYGNNGKYPVIPRIITLPDHNLNMRQELNIPTDSVVFGGYGGKTQFDIEYVRNTVYKIAKNNKKIFFLFANFEKFCEKLNNIIHLPFILEDREKVRFINSCDAMLWGRSDGETFGQAIAEFSIRNKPVIVSKVGALSHVTYLGDKGIWYSNEINLTDILLNFDPEIENKKDWNAYKDYTPEKVMKNFDNLFLKTNNIIEPYKTNNTFCTFWFDIGNKNISDVKNNLRSKQTYLNSFNKLTNKCDKIYVWCDDSLYKDIKHFQNDNIIIKQKNITELPLYNKKSEIVNSLTVMYKNKEKTRYSRLFKDHGNIEAIANYLIIINSKFYMIKTIKDINPFNSHLFSWIDFGILQHNFGFNNYNKFTPNYTETLNICCNYNNDISSTKVTIPDRLYIYNDNYLNIEFLFSVFTLNINFIDFINKHFYDYLLSLLSQNYISTEQTIFTLFYKNFNINTINIYKGDYDSLSLLLKNNITSERINLNNLSDLNQDELEQIQNVNGLMTIKQYELIYKIIKTKYPCNVLVFGLGEDSYLWKSANKGGNTIFIENIKSWGDKFPDLDVEIVNYKTTVLDFPNNLNEEKLLLDLSEDITKIKWDIVIIDSPVGHNPPCSKGSCKLCSYTNPAPGRMSSIFSASKLIHNNSIVIIDDINREIEKKSTEMYITNKFKLQYNDGKVMILYN